MFAVFICSQGYGHAKEVPISSSPESGQKDGFDLRSDTDPDPYPSNVDPDEPLGAHKAQPVAEVSSSVATQQISMTESKYSTEYCVHIDKYKQSQGPTSM